MITGQLGFYTVGTTLLNAINAALQETPGGAISRVGMVPGTIAWDDCDCGLLACAVTSEYLSDTFPLPLTDNASPCAAAWLVGQLVVQVIRCAPTIKIDGAMPSVSELDASAQSVIADAWQLMSTVPCLLETMKDAGEIIEYNVARVTAQGPLGGCVGNELSVFIGLGRA